MPTRRATPFTIQKPRRASDEILPAVLKTGSIPGVPQNGILAWFIARLDAPYETVEIEIQKDVYKYQVKNFQDIKAPLDWIEGTKGEVILSPLDKRRIADYRKQYLIGNIPDIEEIMEKLNINPDLGSGIWTDEWQQIMNELNISEGDLLSYEQFSIAHQRILEIPDGHLSSTWYETVNTTETETKDVTNDIRRQIEYIWNNARSPHMQYIVKMLPSELRAHERTEALYDFIKLYEHYGYMLPKDGYMQLESRRISGIIRAHFATIRTRKTITAEYFAGIFIQHTFAKMYRKQRSSNSGTICTEKPKHDPASCETESTPIVELLPSPTSIVDTTAEIKTPTAKPRFGKTGTETVTRTRSHISASLRSRATTPTASLTPDCTTDITDPGGAAKQAPWIAGGFDYEAWAQRTDTPLAPKTRAATHEQSPHRRRHRGSYEQYIDSQRRALVRSLPEPSCPLSSDSPSQFTSPFFRPPAHVSSQPKAESSKKHYHRHARHVHSTSLAIPTYGGIGSPEPPDCEPEEMFAITTNKLSLPMTATEPSTDPTDQTPADTAETLTDTAAAPTAPTATTNYDFGLPPKEHPSLHTGYGSYFESHRHGDLREHHGYEFTGFEPQLESQYDNELSQHDGTDSCTQPPYHSEPGSYSDEPSVDQSRSDSDSDPSDHDHSATGEEEPDSD